MPLLSGLATAAATYTERVEKLLPTASSLSAIEGVVSLPLQLDVLPTALQYLISSGSGIEDHVAYLSLERLCLQALGQARLMPSARYTNLMNAGAGKFGKVLLLNDMFPMVTRLLPAMLKAADAFGLTQDDKHHAVSRLHASLQLCPLVELLQQIEDDNAKFNPRRGLEGPMGNFSLVVRRSAICLKTQLSLQVELAMQIGAPQRCINALSPLPTMTLNVETFFTGQRMHWPNPYPLQYAQRWATAVLVESFRNGAAAPFSAIRKQHSGRGHYHDNSALASTSRRYQPARPKLKSSRDPTARLRSLHILRSAEQACSSKQGKGGSQIKGKSELAQSLLWHMLQEHCLQ